MSKLKVLIVFITFIFMAPIFVFADLKDAPVIKKSGNWSVRKTKDFMTDKTTCVALYKNRFDIQVNEGTFYIDMRGKGGVDGYEYKIDDEESNFELPTNIMKESSLVIFDGEIFQKLLTAKIFRVQIMTVLGGLEQDDINLTGLSDVYPTLTGPKCK